MRDLPPLMEPYDDSGNQAANDLLTEVEWLRRNPVHPSMVCWSCKSRNVASTDWDAHGQALAVNPSRNGRFTVRCEDCGAVWEGQLRCVQPSLSGRSVR